jgi:hypothetical protein
MGVIKYTILQRNVQNATSKVVVKNRALLFVIFRTRVLVSEADFSLIFNQV